MVVEWYTHMFSREQERYPLHPEAPYVPEPPEGDPLDAQIAHMDREGIDRAVLVQPCPYWEDHRLILDCLAREPDRFKGVCVFRPKFADSPERLAEMVARQPLFVATRFHLLEGRNLGADSALDPGIQAIWRKALELGLIIEFNMDATHALPLANMLRDHPESTIVIDHLAEPHRSCVADYANLLDLARFDNVYMKLSGLSHFAADGPDFLSARPLTRRVIREFGPDRMVWGGDTPGVVDAHMPEYSEADRAKVKGDNLAGLLGFG